MSLYDFHETKLGLRGIVWVDWYLPSLCHLCTWERIIVHLEKKYASDNSINYKLRSRLVLHVWDNSFSQQLFCVCELILRVFPAVTRLTVYCWLYIEICWSNVEVCWDCMGWLIFAVAMSPMHLRDSYSAPRTFHLMLFFCVWACSTSSPKSD